jgi:hypothetical protein
MKVLLLTDIPPCRNFPTGRALDQLCRFFPRGSVSCFAITDRFVEPELAPDLDSIPIACTPNRVEHAFRPFRRQLSFPFAWAAESLRRRFAVPRLAAKAIAFGREQRVELVWAVLQGQTLIKIAPDVARGIGVPLVTQVRKAPIWSLIEHLIDRVNRRATLADFGKALGASRICVTASQAMASDYQKRYGVPCMPLHVGYPNDAIRSPNLSEFPGATIEIGVSTIPDAPGEWLQLLRALNMSGWQVRGRPVRVNVIGAAVAPGEAPPGRVRHFGWRSPSETPEVLSTFDILYQPVQFASGLGEAANLSFPAGFPCYLAAGRPILLHGPASAAASDYLKQTAAGHVVADYHAAAIYNALCRLVDNPSEYRRLGEAAAAAFRRDFTHDAARSSFRRVLDLVTAGGANS